MFYFLWGGGEIAIRSNVILLFKSVLKADWVCSIITNRQYVDIKMAIRSFGDPQTPNRNLANIDTNLCLKFFTDIFHSNIKTGKHPCSLQAKNGVGRAAAFKGLGS